MHLQSISQVKHLNCLSEVRRTRRTVLFQYDFPSPEGADRRPQRHQLIWTLNLWNSRYTRSSYCYSRFTLREWPRFCRSPIGHTIPVLPVYFEFLQDRLCGIRSAQALNVLPVMQPVAISFLCPNRIYRSIILSGFSEICIWLTICTVYWCASRKSLTYASLVLRRLCILCTAIIVSKGLR